MTESVTVGREELLKYLIIYSHYTRARVAPRVSVFTVQLNI